MPTPTPTDALASARWILLQLNTKGLRLLWEGQEEAAFELLQHCSRAAHRLLEKEQEQQVTSACPSKQVSSSSAKEITPVLAHLTLDGVLTPIEETDSNSTRTTPHEFFRHVLLVEDCEHEPIGTPLSSLSTCALFCYNLAVLYHEVGTVRGCFQALGKAQAWYMAALHYLRMDDSTHSTPWLLRAALHGNLCRVATMWGDWKAAVHCHAVLLSCLTEPQTAVSPQTVQALQQTAAALPLSLAPSCASAA